MDHPRPHWGLLAGAGLLLVAALVLVITNPLRINHDVTLHLLAATHIVEGRVPYVDFFNINFPMIFYLDTLPVVVSRMLGVPLILAMNTGALLLTGLSAGALVAITFRYDERHLGSKLAFGLAAFGLVAAAMNQLGQREHLFVVLYLPFLLLRWYEWRGRDVPPALSIPLGILGAVGVCIKPYFALIVIAVEGYWLVTHREHWRRLFTPGAIAFAATGLGYLLHLAVLPGVAEGFRIQLGRTLAGYGEARGSSPLLVLVFSAEVTLAAALAGIVIARRKETPQQQLILWLAIFMLGALVSYGAQARGFPYQLLPAMAAGSILMVLVLLPQVPPTPPEKVWLNAGRLLVAVWAAGAFLSPAALRANTHDLTGLTGAIEEQTAADEPVLILSPFPPAYKALLKTERPSAARYLPTMPIIFEIPRELPLEEQYATVTPWIDEMLGIVARDLEAAPPALIIIDNLSTCPSCPPNFNLHTYFQRIEFLAEAVYPAYMYLGEVDNMVLYRHIGEPGSAMAIPVNFGAGQTLIAWEMPAGQAVRPCDPLTLQTWWQASRPVEQDFSLGAVVSGPAGVIGQNDAPPANINTTQWLAGTQYVDERTIVIDCDAVPGDYDLLLTLYEPNFIENQPVELANGQPVGEYFFVTTITVTE
ncbi:MAG: hypothetical protein GYB64_02775 [Chloroflexi bacterium]|nr:hypothetical protein [Chloroflexota bacterium]